MTRFPLHAAIFILAAIAPWWSSAAIAACTGGSPTWTAASANRNDVNDCVAVARNGDTIHVPAGQATWSSSINVAKNVAIIGAGSDRTRITGSGNCFTLSNANTTRISGFGITNCTISAEGQAAAGASFRVDHNSFTSTGGKISITVKGNSQTPMRHPTGLFDNNTFNNYRVVILGAAGMLSENDTQHQLWSQDPPMGQGTGVVYYEDNVTSVSVGNYLDGNYGARYVGRFNTITSAFAHMEVHSVQGANRAVQWWELYNTTLTNSSQYFGLAFIRGGSGMAWGNRVNAGAQSMKLDNVRSCGDPGGTVGACNGSSNWDQNKNGMRGYACRDQIGRSKDNRQWAPGSSYAQELTPAYFWDNIQGANTQYAVSIHGDCSAGLNPVHLVENRDWYKQNTSFNGTTGVGVGAIANRPQTCTQGVAYWATDQGEWNSTSPGPDGQLYKCSAQNTWTLHYIPYTYPHPLRDGGSVPPPPPPDAPEPPTSLQTTVTD